MYVQRNSQERSCMHCCSGKAIKCTYSQSIQHAMHVSHIVTCGLFCSTIFFFFTLFLKRLDFRDKKFLNMMCVLIFSTTFF